MMSELEQLVAWWPPEDLRKNCETWYNRCKLCIATHRRPHDEAPYAAVSACKPFYRLQIDLMDVTPKGLEGESFILTALCVATRYPCLRVGKDKDAVSLAELLLDIILDIGVVPAIIQSDNEFATLALEELCTMLGSTQLFSTVLRPQSQGITERSHLDIRKGRSLLVEAFVQANPRKWPTYVRWLESKLRHKLKATGDTPYSAVHGFAGSTALRSALGALEEIPEDMVSGDWLRMIVAETKSINSRLGDHWARTAEARARRHDESRPSRPFQVGDMVLLSKPFWEKGAGLILPQCDGPYVITHLPTVHTAVLEDPTTMETYHHGQPISVARLVRFQFPTEWSGPELTPGDAAANRDLVSKLRVGSFVAVEPELPGIRQRVYLGRVDRTFPAERLAELSLLRTSNTGQAGPWQRRRWDFWMMGDGKVRKELVPEREILCEVTLSDQALTSTSLERLAVFGVDVGTQPHRDRSLPPRRAL